MAHKPPSQDDIELFRKAVGPVKRISNDRVEPAPRRSKPYPKFRHQDEAEVLENLLSDWSESADIETGDELSFIRPGLQHNVLRKLRRGQLAVGGELDLHGMTVSVARQELGNFLHQCANSGIRCARIIHGKGNRSKHQQPILKTKVNNWLRHWDTVLAFCSARRTDGGTGAIYVLLKKSR